MNDRATMHVGPLGSAIHVLRADAQTVEQLAEIDWNRHFRRVCLDPVRGLITLMSPSRLHEDLSEILGEIVGSAADALGRVSKGLRSTRLRGSGEPPGTGMEPDCTFYLGDRADGYQAALIEGEAAADAFLERTAPDLVVEVELTGVAPVQWTPSDCAEEVFAMAKTHPPYAPEFRRQMVELVRSGRSAGELAREFGCCSQTIRNWVRQTGRDEGRRDDGLTSSELEELRRLRRENRRLREEREILKKAAVWFARETGSVPGRSSSS